MNCCIIGKGSIGIRHSKNLYKLKIKTFFLRRKIITSNKNELSLNDKKIKKMDFFIITNPSSLHQETIRNILKYNKPILLDFTGWACANCRRVEENTWSDPAVYDLINNKFILISLYVDDRTDLGDGIITLRDKNGNKKILETVGEKWSAFQTLNFKINSQPYYVLISPNLNILNSPIQYTDTESYKRWLNEGLESFTSQNKRP